MNRDFTPRMQQILIAMLKEDRILSVKNLAEIIGVSKRTVQREMEYMGSSLQKKYGITFCSKAGTGVWLEGEAENKMILLELLEKGKNFDALDKTERRKRLILEILKDKNLKKLFYYSNLFGVSEATISTDLEAVEGWFEKFHLHIVRKQGYGVAIEGEEKDFRRAIRTFIDDNIDTKMIREVYENRNETMLEKISRKNGKTIYYMLDNDILKTVVNTLSELKEDRIMNLTENSYVGLVLHITIALNRILKQEIIEDHPSIHSYITKDEDYELARTIGKILGEKFKIVIPETEIVYICLHLKWAKTGDGWHFGRRIRRHWFRLRDIQCDFLRRILSNRLSCMGAKDEKRRLPARFECCKVLSRKSRVKSASKRFPPGRWHGVP